MKKSYRTILYTLVGLMILSGFLLFLFRTSLFGFLQERADLIVPTVSSLIVATSSDALDLSVLKSPRFTALVNNVINFDFDNICYRPVSAKTTIIIPQAEQTTTTTVPLTCVQGNNYPFFIKEK